MRPRGTTALAVIAFMCLSPAPAPAAGTKPPAPAAGSRVPAAPRAKTFLAEGVLRSQNRVEVRSKVASPIRKIAVEEGATVKEGDLLVEMESGAERAQLEAARAEVERAQSALAEADMRKKTADRELERNLSVQDLITRRELEISRDAAEQAANALETRRKELAKAEAQLTLATALSDNTRITSPFDALVSRVYVRPGTVPKAADTTILDLVSLDGLYVEVAMPLQYLKKVRKGMPAKILVEDGHASTRVRTTGTVKYVYPEIDPATRMFRVKIDVERQGSHVLPGMFAKVDLGLK